MQLDPDKHSLPRNAYIATVVWGDWHQKVFLDYTLPSLLTPGNFLVLGQHFENVIYTIITEQSDVQQIKEHSNINKLHDKFGFEVNILGISGISNGNVFENQHAARAEVAALAAENKGFFITVFPDVLIADGGIAHLIKKMQTTDTAAFYFVCPRVTAETFLSSLEKNKIHSPEELFYTNRALTRATLKHLHPQTRANFISSKSFPGYSDWVVLPVTENDPFSGIWLHSSLPSDFLAVRYDLVDFPLTPFQTIENLDDIPNNQVKNSLSKICFLTNSMDFLAVSPTPEAQYADWYGTRGPIDLVTLAKRSKNTNNEMRTLLASQKFLIRDRELPKPERQKSEMRVRILAARLAALVLYLKIRDCAAAANAQIATDFLSLLIFQSTRLITRQRWAEPTVVIPSDEAWSEILPYLPVPLSEDPSKFLPEIFSKLAFDGAVSDPHEQLASVSLREIDRFGNIQVFLGERH